LSTAAHAPETGNRETTTIATAATHLCLVLISINLCLSKLEFAQVIPQPEWSAAALALRKYSFPLRMSSLA
jgi:hypothetical protein